MGKKDLLILYSHNYNYINPTVLQIHIQIQRRILIHGRLRCSGTNAVLNFWLRFFDTRRETILKSLSWSYYTNNTPNVWNISWCFRSQFIFAGWDPKNLTATATAENSTVCLHDSMPIFNSMVGLQLLNTMVRPSFSTSWSDPNFSTPWSDPTCS